MVSTPPVNTAALSVLRQAASLSPSAAQERPQQDALLAAANGSTGVGHLSQTRGKIAEALFDRSTPDVTEMKVHLYERLGKEFGISMADFDTPRAFGAAISEKISQIKRDANGALILSELEKKLGLDKLGISLDTLVDAIINVGGDSDKKLTEAIKKKMADDSGDGQHATKSIPQLKSDEIGLYRF